MGIITGHANLLKEEHLRKAGVPADLPLAIAGMENAEEFKKVVISGAAPTDRHGRTTDKN